MQRAFGVALALCLASASAQASEPDLFGFGARASGMAGLGAADAEGYDAVYANPAGLVGPSRRRLSLGYVGVRNRLSLDGKHRRVDPTDGVLLGAELPLPFGGPLADRIAVGLGFYYPIGVINRARDAYPDVARLALLDDRTQVVSVMVAAGVKLHRRVSIGGGVLALAALTGEIAIRPDASGRITTVAEEQLLASYAPLVGVRAVASAWCKVGLVYRGESRSRYDIAIKNNLGAALPIQVPTLHIAGNAQYDPHQLQLEGAFQAIRWLRLDLGITWKHWSAYENPVENATPGAPPQPPPGYHDTVVPRIAGEATQAFRKLVLRERLGYFFEQSPAPQGPERTLLDADRHALTVGLALEWHGPLFSYVLDAFAQWHHLDGNPRVGGDLAVFGATFGIDL